MRVAAVQRGHFTARQAREVGYSYQAQAFHVDHGNWERIDRGLFRLPHWPIQIDDHLVRWTIWSNALGVVSHDSALAQHDLGDVNPSRLHLTVPRAFGKQDGAVVLHRLIIVECDVDERDGYRLSSPARALAESVASGLAPDLAEQTLREAIDRQLFSIDELIDTAQRISERAAAKVRRALLSSGV